MGDYNGSPSARHFKRPYRSPAHILSTTKCSDHFIQCCVKNVGAGDGDALRDCLCGVVFEPCHYYGFLTFIAYISIYQISG